MNSADAYFEDLMIRVVDEVATEEEFSTFEEILLHDAELRRIYIQCMRAHALLCCRGEENTAGKRVPKSDGSADHTRGVRKSEKRESWKLETRDSKPGEIARQPGRFHVWWKAAAAAAVLLGGTAIWRAEDLWRSEALGVKRDEMSASAAQPVRLMSQKNIKGLDLPGTVPGLLRLESGEIVVRLDTGVELTLLGPVAVDIRSNMRVYLERGRLLANVPHWATGFTVFTAGLEIYDLGTVFSVNEAEGVSDVFVFKGSVQVNEAGFSESGRETSGSGVGVCEAGEGVRSVRGELPVKFETDWVEAQKMFRAVHGDAAVKDPAAALKTAGHIADLWAERYMPGSNLLPKKVVKGNGIKFEKTAWVRTVAPRQEEEARNMNKASATAALSATVVLMGAWTAEATSAPIQVDSSPGYSRHWRTVFTNEVPLTWNWFTAATHAELGITGMNGCFTTNFTEVTTNFLWRAFASSAPSVEDVYDLTLTFYSNSESVVGVLTSQLAVVTAAFGRTAVFPTPGARGWTTVRDNVVIPYDSGWTAATADAAHSRLVIAKVSGMTQTNALSDAAGYFGWKLKHSDWGYGTFNLALTFPNAEGEWDATLTRQVYGTMIQMR